MPDLLDITFLVALLTMPSSPAVYKVTNMECIPENKYIVNISCRLKPISWQHTFIDVDVHLKLPLQKPIMVFSSFTKNHANHYKPFIVNYKANICDIVSGRFPSIYSRYAGLFFKLYTNVNHNCPFTGHIYSKNVSVPQNFQPVLPPNGLYMLMFQYYEKVPSERIATSKIFITVSDDIRERIPKNKTTKH